MTVSFSDAWENGRRSGEMTMKLYFVRHGETEWNVQKKIQGSADIPLNENGLQQAHRLAGELRRQKLDGRLHLARAYTSPQLRAAKTAEAAAEALQIPCLSCSGLREMDLGEWEGSNWDIIRESYGAVYIYWNEHRRYTHTPGGESYQEVLARTLAALAKILEQETEDVLVVTHSAVLMALRCYLAKLPFEEMVKRYKTKNAEVVIISEEEIREALLRFDRGE